MSDKKPDVADALPQQQQIALARWDTEGGAGSGGPQQTSGSPDAAVEPSLSDNAHHLAAALSESLKAIEDDYIEEMHELQKLFEEARNEAKKSEPNAMKLKALLTDGNEMVRTFAALDPAWQGVQRVARMLGVL